MDGTPERTSHDTPINSTASDSIVPAISSSASPSSPLASGEVASPTGWTHLQGLATKLASGTSLVVIGVVVAAFALRGCGAMELKDLAVDGLPKVQTDVLIPQLKHQLQIEQSRLNGIARTLKSNPNTPIFQDDPNQTLFLGPLMQEQYNAINASEPVPTADFTILNSTVNSELVNYLLRLLFRQDAIRVRLSLQPGQESITAISERGRTWQVNRNDLTWLVPLMCTDFSAVPEDVEPDDMRHLCSSNPSTRTRLLLQQVRTLPDATAQLLIDALALLMITQNGQDSPTSIQAQRSVELFRLRSVLAGFPVDGSGWLEQLVHRTEDPAARASYYALLSTGCEDLRDDYKSEDEFYIARPHCKEASQNQGYGDLSLWQSTEFEVIYDMWRTRYIHYDSLDTHPIYGNFNNWCNQSSKDASGVMPIADGYWEAEYSRLSSITDKLIHSISANDPDKIDTRQLKSLLLASHYRKFIVEHCYVWDRPDEPDLFNGGWINHQAFFPLFPLIQPLQYAFNLGLVLQNPTPWEQRLQTQIIRNLTWRTSDPRQHLDLMKRWEALAPQDPDLYAERAERAMQRGDAVSLLEADTQLSRAFALFTISQHTHQLRIPDRLLLQQATLGRRLIKLSQKSSCAAKKIWYSLRFGKWQDVQFSMLSDNQWGHRNKSTSRFALMSGFKEIKPIEKMEVLTFLSSPCQDLTTKY